MATAKAKISPTTQLEGDPAAKKELEVKQGDIKPDKLTSRGAYRAAAARLSRRGR